MYGAAGNEAEKRRKNLWGNEVAYQIKTRVWYMERIRTETSGIRKPDHRDFLPKRNFFSQQDELIPLGNSAAGLIFDMTIKK